MITPPAVLKQRRCKINKTMKIVATFLVLFLVPVVVWALEVEGTYDYIEEGYTGTMTITRMGPGFVFAFDTTSKSNGRQCQFETYETPMGEGGYRVNDELPAHGGTKEDGVKFDILFTRDTVMVDVESTGEECGMSGFFGGKYVKTRD